MLNRSASKVFKINEVKLTFQRQKSTNSEIHIFFQVTLFTQFVSLRQVKDIVHNFLRLRSVSRLQNKQKYANVSPRLIINSLNSAAMEIKRKH